MMHYLLNTFDQIMMSEDLINSQNHRRWMQGAQPPNHFNNQTQPVDQNHNELRLMTQFSLLALRLEDLARYKIMGSRRLPMKSSTNRLLQLLDHSRCSSSMLLVPSKLLRTHKCNRNHSSRLNKQ